jgi:hypothetical protein
MVEKDWIDGTLLLRSFSKHGNPNGLLRFGTSTKVEAICQFLTIKFTKFFLPLFLDVLLLDRFMIAKRLLFYRWCPTHVIFSKRQLRSRPASPRMRTWWAFPPGLPGRTQPTAHWTFVATCPAPGIPSIALILESWQGYFTMTFHTTMSADQKMKLTICYNNRWDLLEPQLNGFIIFR